MLRVNSATRNLAANAEFVETPGQIPPPYGRRDDSEFAFFYKAGISPIIHWIWSYYSEREMLNVVIPSAARNLPEKAARCFASLSMTFNHFRSR